MTDRLVATRLCVSRLAKKASHRMVLVCLAARFLVGSEFYHML